MIHLLKNMERNYWIGLILFFSTFIFTSCSSTTENTEISKQPSDSSYVFDDVPPEDFITIETPAAQPGEVYILQIGAFSSFEKAKLFAESSRTKLNHEIKVSFNEKNNLYVVQIHPAFDNKQDAVNYQNELDMYDEYKDSWIITLIPSDNK